ncbi:hypothetical protein [Micromonospora tulbaghiae]|uniref:hypothetical protein n=1 Tax=Micromonospora tulbaghiae TaxID=479978 RepID=UPI0013C49662|nr:hypothetical protein [Micromonospora tulbaghiae]
MGDGFGVAGGAEQSLDAGGGDVGEEGEQVDADDDRLCGVGGGEGVRGAAGYEAVGGGVDRDGAEDLGEQPALQGAEPGLGCLDQPAALGPSVVVVVQPVGGGAAVHGASVGVPVEVPCPGFPKHFDPPSFDSPPSTPNPRHGFTNLSTTTPPATAEHDKPSPGQTRSPTHR